MKASMVFFLICTMQVLSGQNSFLSFDSAMIQAKEENKNVLVVFSGSDWCKPCIQFKTDVLESNEFKSQDEVILLYLDFPYKKKNKLSKSQQDHNELLAEKYNEEGAFPKVILFNANSEILSVVDYQKSMTAGSFMNQLKSTLNK